jgi:NTP pyrophosphatase (non-canonical NTP hydrolase)
MTLNDYQEGAWRTMRPFRTEQEPAVYYLGLGLAEETGEVARRLKRMISGGRIRPSHPDRGALVLELGDVLWYISAIASEIGVSLEEVGLANQQKLGLRRTKE